MRPEILHIKNFGPVTDIRAELRYVNIFIGDNGTGKSTLAKVLAAVKAMLDETFLIDTAQHYLAAESKPGDEEDVQLAWQKSFAKWLDWTGLTNCVYPDSFIRFQNEEYSFLYKNGAISITSTDVDFDVPATPFEMYIPAYREVAIVLKDKLFAILQAKATLPDILTRFGTGFLEARTKKSFYDYTDVFGVMYRHSNGMDYITLKDGRKILIEDASSALRNGVPMLVVFDNMLLKREGYYCPYLIVEEPELNCFPETQEKLMKYFIEHLKLGEEGYKNRLLITTHSPYILTSANNLMQAFHTGKTDAAKVGKVIPTQYWLNPDDVSAYMLLKDGTCKDIMNREEYLIEADEIDSVSRKLNKEFDDLLNIEFGAEEG